MKRKAMEMCEWNGGDYYYGSRKNYLRKSMMKKWFIRVC